jgi:hypothetical protein
MHSHFSSGLNVGTSKSDKIRKCTYWALGSADQMLFQDPNDVRMPIVGDRWLGALEMIAIDNVRVRVSASR